MQNTGPVHLPRSPQLPEQVVQESTGHSRDAEMANTTSRTLPDPPPDLFQAEVILRATTINSIFKLSSRDNFRCNLEAVASFPVGRFCTLKSSGPRSGDASLEMCYPGFNGKCTVQRNGFVKCNGQRSIEEAVVLAKRIVWDFIHLSGDKSLNLCEHKFSIMMFDGEFPWKVNLMKMKGMHSEIKYEPQVGSSHAVARFKDLDAHLNLYQSGKFKLFCSGDCDPLNPAIPKALEAVRRLGSLASRYIIAGPVVQQMEDEEEEMRDIHTGNSPQRRQSVMVPRRSDRLAALGISHSPEHVIHRARTPDYILIQTLDLLNEKEDALYELFKELAKRVFRRDMVRTIQGVFRSKKDCVDSASLREEIEKVSDVFSMRSTLDPAVRPIPEGSAPLVSKQTASANKLKTPQATGEKRKRGRPPKSSH
ncbi:uncharacterized protein LOC129581660 [Paramacrobiotus metropolitanus]|uniref:uncharacterized protein LOC129581660 n=1 Tax=Paramacrobiotus metropolitanus TaxID=2943436 RepID=UPI00244567AF|nr:uncharacterized protein LOC129581660 [Paramacrobiotus metropolitanus]